MLRITGDISALIALANYTNSLPLLRDRLGYLNKWGGHAASCIMVDMLIGKVSLDKEQADVSLRFYGNSTPGLFGAAPEPRMHGGLNLFKVAEDEFNWSVNT